MMSSSSSRRRWGAGADCPCGRAGGDRAWRIGRDDLLCQGLCAAVLRTQILSTATRIRTAFTPWAMFHFACMRQMPCWRERVICWIWQPRSQTSGQCAAASIAVAEVKAYGTEAAQLAANKLIELGGARSPWKPMGRSLLAQRRTHSLHDRRGGNTTISAITTQWKTAATARRDIGFGVTCPPSHSVYPARPSLG